MRCRSARRGHQAPTGRSLVFALTSRCIYATHMSAPAGMLRDARMAAGLSARALAVTAGTSTTTVTRIEAGTMDPTIGMLDRLLRAAGRELELTTKRPSLPAPLSLADLTDAWSRTPVGDRPDWPRLRALLDWLALHPDGLRAALAPTPPPSRSAMQDALLAGIADTLADDHGLRRPSWTRAANRFLSTPWETPGTARTLRRLVAGPKGSPAEHPGRRLSAPSRHRARRRHRLRRE